MSVCDDMREVMEYARIEDECDYSVYSQMFDLIGEVEDENAKLRSMVEDVLVLIHDPTYEWLDLTMADLFGKGFTEQARELGIEVE